ncbi:MAG: phosphatase PAP2 family protein [Dehalococcoidia bacterium]|nr:phosphatase PAP2 family protein [Dehalococcoidia bacterium]
MIGAGAVLSVIVAANPGPLEGDQALADAIQGFPAWFEPVSVGVRALTTTQVVLVIGAALVAWLWAQDLRRHALAIGLCLVVLPFAQAGIKEVVDRPRPADDLVEVRTGWTSESYPSGHVMSGTLLFGYMAQSRVWLARLPRRQWRNAIRLGAVAILGLNLLANVYMGVHWPSDVLGGALFGAALVAIALAIERRVPR